MKYAILATMAVTFVLPAHADPDTEARAKAAFAFAMVDIPPAPTPVIPRPEPTPEPRPKPLPRLTPQDGINSACASMRPLVVWTAGYRNLAIELELPDAIHIHTDDGWWGQDEPGVVVCVPVRGGAAVSKRGQIRAYDCSVSEVKALRDGEAAPSAGRQRSWGTAGAGAAFSVPAVRSSAPVRRGG